MLRRILCSNPDTHIPPELFIQDLVQVYARYRKIKWRDFVYLITANIDHRHKMHPYSFTPLVNQLLLLPKKDRSMAKIIARLAEFDAKQKGLSCTRWGDKTPLNFKIMNEIMYMFPDARFIHVYRDGCDVVQSFVNAKLREYEEAAREWVQSLEAIKAFPYPDRVYSLRYEDLVSNPEEYVREVCSFLDISFSTDMLEVNDKAKSALSEEKSRQHHVNLHKPVSTQSIGKGRATIPENQLKQIAPIINPWLEKLHYSPCQEKA